MSFAKARTANSKIIADKLIENMFTNMNTWDKPLRAFELIDFTFVINLSASAYAQIKRHRIATIIEQGYDFSSLPVIPDSINKAGFKKEIINLSKESRKISEMLIDINPALSPYSALNSSKRSVIMKMNGRELYHFVRLRSDEHAQWEIRKISDLIAAAARKADPILFRMLSGKHQFNIF